MHERLSQVLAPYQGQRGALIPVLQKAQETLGYLSEETISEVANFLGLSKNEVYGVATFYADFRFERQAQYTVKVCECPACYLKGAQRILEAVEEELGIQPGETTEDYRFGLERVACLGECALAPAIAIDDTVYGNITTDKARKLLAEYQGK